MNQESNNMQEPGKSSSEWVDPSGYFFNKLVIKDNTITTNCYWGYAFGKSILGKISSFSIAFDKFSERVAIGVASRSYSGLESFAASQYSISYYDDGRCYVGEKEYAKKNGFKAGQRINVEIDMYANTVKFKVGEQIRYIVNTKILDEYVQWVPFVYLARKGDSISLY